MLEDGKILIGKSAKPEYLTLRLANRHGLVTGATGTGKTVTLQVLAEGFSNAGVPVFAADIKGDLSGIAAAGRRQGRPSSSAPRRSASTTTPDRFPGRLLGPVRRAGPSGPRHRHRDGAAAARRACSSSTTRRKACSTSPSASPTTQRLPLLDLKDLRALLNFVAENADEPSAPSTATSPRPRSASIQRQLLVLENQGADKFFGEPALDICRTSCAPTATAAASSTSWPPTS